MRISQLVISTQVEQLEIGNWKLEICECGIQNKWTKRIKMVVRVVESGGCALNRKGCGSSCLGPGRVSGKDTADCLHGSMRLPQGFLFHYLGKA